MFTTEAETRIRTNELAVAWATDPFSFLSIGWPQRIRPRGNAAPRLHLTKILAVRMRLSDRD